MSEAEIKQECKCAQNLQQRTADWIWFGYRHLLAGSSLTAMVVSLLWYIAGQGSIYILSVPQQYGIAGTYLMNLYFV